MRSASPASDSHGSICKWKYLQTKGGWYHSSYTSSSDIQSCRHLAWLHGCARLSRSHLSRIATFVSRVGSVMIVALVSSLPLPAVVLMAICNSNNCFKKIVQYGLWIWKCSWLGTDVIKRRWLPDDSVLSATRQMWMTNHLTWCRVLSEGCNRMHGMEEQRPWISCIVCALCSLRVLDESCTDHKSTKIVCSTNLCTSKSHQVGHITIHLIYSFIIHNRTCNTHQACCPPRTKRTNQQPVIEDLTWQFAYQELQSALFLRFSPPLLATMPMPLAQSCEEPPPARP